MTDRTRIPPSDALPVHIGTPDRAAPSADSANQNKIVSRRRPRSAHCTPRATVRRTFSVLRAPDERESIRSVSHRRPSSRVAERSPCASRRRRTKRLGLPSGRSSSARNKRPAGIGAQRNIQRNVTLADDDGNEKKVRVLCKHKNDVQALRDRLCSSSDAWRTGGVLEETIRSARDI